MKSGSQKTEFQGEFGARHETNLKKNEKLEKYIKLPGPDRLELSGNPDRYPDALAFRKAGTSTYLSRFPESQGIQISFRVSRQPGHPDRPRLSKNPE